MKTALANPSDTGDIQVLGSSEYILVRSDDSDPRDWLSQSPICPLLSQHHIAHTGILWARYPFEIKRRFQSGSFMMACLSGEGKVMVDGAWKLLKAGEACLLPPFVLNTFKCIEGQPWDFCWVRYLESQESKPIVTQHSPVLGRYDHGPMLAAIRGLYAECTGAKNPGCLDHWIDLIHHYVLLFAQPHDYDDRLWRLWQTVEPRLEKKWTLAELAGIAHVSEEHLRRLCRQRTGRSPMQHLTFLRMQRAKHLLRTTDHKIETIAHAVSYENPFTFSTGLGMIFLAATIYGIGKTFFWPTMLGVVSEQFPKGGALSLNAVSGIGMLSVGILGVPLIGAFQEKNVIDAISNEQPAVLQEIVMEKDYILGDYEAIDPEKFASLPEEDREDLAPTIAEATQNALKKVTIFPFIMLISYIGLSLYFRKKGGYEPVDLSPNKVAE